MGLSDTVTLKPTVAETRFAVCRVHPKSGAKVSICDRRGTRRSRGFGSGVGVCLGYAPNFHGSKGIIRITNFMGAYGVLARNYTRTNSNIYTP